MKNSLVKNSIFNFIYRFFDICIPIISSVYVSRVLLAEGVGRVAYAQTIVAYFLTVAALGLPNYGVRAIAAKGKNSGETDKVFSELFMINTISTLLMIVAYYGIVCFLGMFESDKTIFLVMGLLLVSNLFNIDWFYQGTENYRFIAVRSMVIKTGMLVPLFIFVKNREHCLAYAVITAIMYLITQLVNLPHIVKHLKIHREGMKIKKHLKPVFILFASAVATEIYVLFDSTMLGLIHGNIYVGYYTNATKLVRMLFSLVTAFVATIYPRISRYVEENKEMEAGDMVATATEATKYVMIPSTLGIAVAADYVVPALYGNSFEGSISPLRILSILLLLFSYAYTMGHIVLMAFGKDSVILRSTICGAVCNLVLNLVLIPEFKQTGAAIASVVAEMLVTVLLLNGSRKLMKHRQDNKTVKELVLAGVFLVMLIGLKLIFDRIEINIIAKFLIYVVIAIICYLAMSFWWAKELFAKIKKYSGGENTNDNNYCGL